jgi:hypothetical protein
MKNILVAALSIFLTYSSLIAQNQFEVIADNDGSRILKGIISREQVEKDTSYAKWWDNSLRGYSANSDAVSILRHNKDSIQLVAFMGTWCDDSHFIIPKFYNMLDQAGFSKDKVSLIGVDRAKKTLGYLSEALNVKNVPTVIVMRGGKEIGRVVEYGKYGLIDKEIGEIIKAADHSTH